MAICISGDIDYTTTIKLIEENFGDFLGEGAHCKAVANGTVDPVIFEFQTRFSYWVSMFESFYGNIATFWKEMESSESTKLITLNNLMINLIKTNTNTDGKETSNQSESL